MIFQIQSKLKRIIKEIPGAYSAYKLILEIYKEVPSRMKSTEAIFTEIYKKNYWRGKNSVSGQGSDLEQTQAIVKELPILIKDLKISTMLDIPCGDFFWMKMVDLNGIHYIGADIVEEIVDRNRRLHQTDKVIFVKLNLLRSDLPNVDLIFCRDCLGHYSFSDIFKALKNMRRSGSSYLLTTTFPERKDNRDIKTGQWRTLNLESVPFYFPPPQSLLVEQCTQKTSKGEYKDKSLGLWKISDIPIPSKPQLSFVVQ